MIRRPPRSTLSSSSAASDVYKRQVSTQSTGGRLVVVMAFYHPRYAYYPSRPHPRTMYGHVDPFVQRLYQATPAFPPMSVLEQARMPYRQSSSEQARVVGVVGATGAVGKEMVNVLQEACRSDAIKSCLLYTSPSPRDS
eukprot:TRINITY_DN27637_c0_g1_i5.p1 TRINITY_DN27637_c0_g1~~TRINITY_DN27637_c0_g1_i5.p1  ORF type:complete len:139 (+),score=30.40 TRINITY_DN27637_c0_g1_i5:132-548(+)